MYTEKKVCYFLFLAQYIICLPGACQHRPLISPPASWHHKASHVKGKSDKLTWEKHHFVQVSHSASFFTLYIKILEISDTVIFPLKVSIKCKL